MRTLASALMLAVIASPSAFAGKQPMKPPVAKKQIHKTDIHGKTLKDPYHWLRERDSEEVLDYLKAENAYTESVMADTKELRATIYEEMVARIKETDLSAPYKDGEYFYYSRTEEGKNYPILCRKKGSLEAEEEIYLDLNALAEGHEYFRAGAIEVSPDHTLVAYAVDTTGGEKHTLRVRTIATGEDHPDIIENVATSLEWANDNQHLFYTTLDETMRPYRLHRHKLGSDAGSDAVLYEETDLAYFISFYRTLSDRYLALYAGNKDTSELRVLNADQPESELRLVAPREKGVEYYLSHHPGNFYLRTNWEAKNFRVMRVKEDGGTLDKAAWEEFLPHRQQVKIESITLFKDHFIAHERDFGQQRIRVHSFADEAHHFIEFDEPAFSVSSSQNAEFDTTTYRFSYTSMTTPNTIYDYGIPAKSKTLVKQTEVLGEFDPADYVAERLFATAKDGKKVPISLVRKKTTPLDGSAPCYLYGYGSYGVTYDPYFSSLRLSLLDRGFVFALAHIRGSAFLGEEWYDDGKLMNKKNTFTDFIACAEHLVAEKYTSKDKLAISGGSAGGLLIGATINMAPDLAEIAVATVPFVDVINTMLDPSLPLTVTEYDEWGNPNEKEAFEYILSYSPYDNVAKQEYPHLLVMAGLNDPRVQYWEPAKWVAKLRDTRKGDSALLLKTNMGAGHGGASGRYEALKEVAFEFAFVLKKLGMAGDG